MQYNAFSLVMSGQDISLKPSDLRGILKYVPQFRDHVFVIALDGSIIADENFANVVTDIAVLKSLHIKIVLAYGIGHQLSALAQARGRALSDVHGAGKTDPATLALATEASALVSQHMAEALTQSGLRFAMTNAVRCTARGVIKGKDQEHSGTVDKLDLDLFHTLLDKDIVPLVAPIVFDRDGHSLRVNSDQLASEIAVQLKASKLIYLSPSDGLEIDEKKLHNIPVAELRKAIARKNVRIEPRLLSKAQCAIDALEKDVPRAHILDGRVFGGLLTEIFDKVGLGTMIHANAYQSIRPARRKDAQAIFGLARTGARTEALRPRTRQTIEQDIANFYVYEIDESIIACVALTGYPRSKTLELGGLFVHQFYEGRGVGRKLVEYATLEAHKRGARKLVALSTQAYAFFQRTCGFEAGTPDDLPTPRRKDYEQNGRNARILVKTLT